MYPISPKPCKGPFVYIDICTWYRYVYLLYRNFNHFLLLLQWAQAQRGRSVDLNTLHHLVVSVKNWWEQNSTVLLQATGERST